MQKFRFSGFLAHKQEHEAFVTKVEAFQNDYEAGKLGLSIEVMMFLQGWVTNHIKGTDKKYSETFHKNGLQ